MKKVEEANKNHKKHCCKYFCFLRVRVKVRVNGRIKADVFCIFVKKNCIMKRILAISLGLLMAIGLFAQEQDPDLQYATELLKPGTSAPDFTLKDINGNSVSLRDFQGRKVVLVFWASWCPDCRAEVPALKELQAKSDPRKVAFVAVSFDRTKEAWEKYVKENEMTGVQLFENAPRKESFVNDAYHVKWIPSLYLIDEKGKVALSTVVLDKVVKALNK